MRVATHEDMTPLVALMSRYYDEYESGPHKHLPLNELSAVMHIDYVLNNGVVWVNDDFTATASVVLAKVWWSDTPYLKDEWIYVVPEKRGTMTGPVLVKKMIEKARELDMPLIMTWTHTGGNLERREKLMEKFGLVKTGVRYQYG